MRLSLLLDCYGVLYVTPEVLLTNSFPGQAGEITNLFKSFEYGSISIKELMDGLLELTKMDDGELRSLLGKGLVLNTSLIDGIKSHLSEMYDVYVFSNTTQSDLNRLCNRDELENVPVIDRYSSELIGVMKPSEESFDRVAMRVGVSSGQCVLVDDMQSNITGAKLSGWDGVQYINTEETIVKLKEIYNARAT